MTKQTGQFELRKFAARKEPYQTALRTILNLGYPPEDYIHHSPAFIGDLTLSRLVTFYELYKMTLGVAGHIAEVGVYKGAGSLLFAKLTKLFEPVSLTQVHGFDWFQGASTTPEERFVSNGECSEDYERLMTLISTQGLDNIVCIHNVDVTKDLPLFFNTNSHLRFKLVFVDCGIYDVVHGAIKDLWPRLTSGGVMAFDHYSHEVAPGETRAIDELLPGAKLKSFSFGWMPTAYVVKE
jgi:hypothetical protein